MLMLGLAAILVQLLIIYVLASLIASPLQKLALKVERINRLEPSRLPPLVSSVREVALLSRAIETLDVAVKAFACFVPVGLVRQLLQSEQKLELGGQSRFLTIFFSDVEGFSTMAENMPSRDLLARMSTLLELVSKAVHEESGTIDKFVGDGVMAFWGAPALLDDHAWHACVAALRIQRALDDLNGQWQRAGVPQMRVRIGIHSDAVLVGNVGSQERMSYTVIGDGVNIAARLEGINKTYGTLTCISHDTFREAGDRLCVRPIDEVAVKGRRARIAIYELLGCLRRRRRAGALARSGAARPPDPPGLRRPGRRRPPGGARTLPRGPRGRPGRSRRRAACPAPERFPRPRQRSEWCVSTTDLPAAATGVLAEPVHRRPAPGAAAASRVGPRRPRARDRLRQRRPARRRGRARRRGPLRRRRRARRGRRHPSAPAGSSTSTPRWRSTRATSSPRSHGRRFDLILANLPHFPMEAAAIGDRLPTWSSGGADGRPLLDPFLAGLGDHLTPSGRAVIAHNAFVGLEATKAAAHRQGLAGRRDRHACWSICRRPKLARMTPEVLQRETGRSIHLYGGLAFGEMLVLTISHDHGAPATAVRVLALLLAPVARPGARSRPRPRRFRPRRTRPWRACFGMPARASRRPAPIPRPTA